MIGALVGCLGSSLGHVKAGEKVVLHPMMVSCLASQRSGRYQRCGVAGDALYDVWVSGGMISARGCRVQGRGGYWRVCERGLNGAVTKRHCAGLTGVTRQEALIVLPYGVR